MPANIRTLVITLSAALWTSAALAAGPEPASGVEADGPFADGMAAAEAEAWTRAASLFQEVVRLDPENADGFNMLAYSQRHLGDMEGAIANYGKALTLDPNHEGAREYLGEALLILGDVDGAKQQLAALERICPTGCEALEELGEAIARHESGSQ